MTEDFKPGTAAATTGTDLSSAKRSSASDPNQWAQRCS